MLDKSRFMIISIDEETYDNIEDVIHTIKESIEDHHLDSYSVLEYIPISTKPCREFVENQCKFKAKASAISVIMSLPKELRDEAYRELAKFIEKDKKNE